MAMTKDVARGRSNPPQGKNPERGYAFCLVMEETMQGIFWGGGRKGGDSWDFLRDADGI